MAAKVLANAVCSRGNGTGSKLTQPNFESLEDSCVDLANYASFFAAYMNNAIDGQTDERDFLNRPVVPKGKTDENV